MELELKGKSAPQVAYRVANSRAGRGSIREFAPLLDRRPVFVFEGVAGCRAALASVAADPAAGAGGDESIAAALCHRLVTRAVTLTPN